MGKVRESEFVLFYGTLNDIVTFIKLTERGRIEYVAF